MGQTETIRKSFKVAKAIYADLLTELLQLEKEMSVKTGLTEMSVMWALFVNAAEHELSKIGWTLRELYGQQD